MAAKTERRPILVRLRPEAFDALASFCQVTGMTRNELIASLVDEVTPHLSELAKLQIEASRGPFAAAARKAAQKLQKLSGQLQREAGRAQYELGLAAARGAVAASHGPSGKKGSK